MKYYSLFYGIIILKKTTMTMMKQYEHKIT